MSQTPTPGTICSECRCCPADILSGDLPICWPCDAGEHNLGLVNSVVEHSQPAAVEAAEPEALQSSEKTMEKRTCACGCGTAMSENNNWLYFRGHKPKDGKKMGTPRKYTKKLPESAPAPEVIEEAVEPLVALELNESQLNRIWESLPIEEKALAIATALTADRS